MLASILELLGIRQDTAGVAQVPDAVHEIVSRLHRLEPRRARYLAAFAVVLSRVANADLDISAVERAKMEELLTERGSLTAEEASMVVQVAAARSQESGGTEHFLATREFNELATRAQREELLDCLFAVSAADESISNAEENQVRQIASELGLTQSELAEIRSKWNRYREILK
jgi:uncharacterized tellurite resistance protein B-like protein